ncbi:MAG: hypothetical protein WDN48_11360 [Pseudolabrys sp.]
MNEQTAVTDGNLTYTYRPSAMGAPMSFTLAPDGMNWVSGGRSGRVRYSDIRRVRMSHRPVNMQPYRFVTEIWAAGAPRLRIASVSWKSMMQQERHDDAYSAFLIELHRRIRQSGAAVRLEQGKNPLIYWVGFAVFGCVCLGLAVLVVRALQADAKAGAAFIALFLGLFLWQGRRFSPPQQARTL